MKHFLLVITCLFTLCADTLAVNTQMIKLSFDIIETEKNISTRDAAFFLSALNKRNSFDKIKYLAGGDFTLPPYVENDFMLRQDACDLKLRISWQPVISNGQRKIDLKYEASLYFPMQNYASIEKSLTVNSGSSQIIIESDSVSGSRDTRPLRILLKAEFLNPVYSYSLLGGIGAKLSAQTGNPFISDVQTGSPADLAGLKFGDEIIEIDGIAASRLTFDKVAALLRGDPGTRVKLKIYKTETKAYEEKEITRQLLEQ